MSPLARISRQIREVLESSLEPDVASAVFFEALSSSQGLPDSPEQAIGLVRGPLHTALSGRIAQDEASRLVARILGRIDPSSSGVRRPGEEDTTRAVPTDSLPVEVVVISAGDGFASKLNAVLGPARVKATRAEGPAEFGAGVDPAVVVVDATDFLPVDAADMLAALRTVPETTVRVLWGSELPYGQRIAKATRPDDPVLLTLPRGGGIDPLLDLIRSRRVDL